MTALLILGLFPCLLQSQMPTDWGAFFQHIDAAPYAGKKFKLEAAVKVQLIDTTASAEIWVRVDMTGKKNGFFYNMMDKPIRSSEWKIFSISGTIDKGAKYFNFGGLYNKKGIFYFDDFKLFIESADGQLEPVNIANGSFESDSLRPGWDFLQKRNGFNIANSTTAFYSGKQSCIVDGSSFKPAYTYGNNDSTGHYALVNGIRIYYEIYGEGQPLLLLHGNTSSIQSFSLQIPELSKHYKVIAADTRGQGKSSEDGKTYTYDLFAQDMNALLNYLALDSVNIIGWSDGGNTGLIMAMKYPRKVRRLVTMGAVLFIDHTVVDNWVFKVLNKQLKEEAADSSSWSKNRIRLINLLLTEPKHQFEELQVINCPVLVMAGEKDIVKEGHTKGIAANIKKGSLLIVPKEKHEYPSDKPNEFNKTVLEFLQQP